MKVDGRDPTEEETAEFLEEKEAQRERETSDDEQGGPPRSPIDSDRLDYTCSRARHLGITRLQLSSSWSW